MARRGKKRARKQDKQTAALEAQAAMRERDARQKAAWMGVATETPPTYIEPPMQERATLVSWPAYEIVRGKDEHGKPATMIRLTGRAPEQTAKPYDAWQPPERIAVTPAEDIRLPGVWDEDTVRSWLAAAYVTLYRLPADADEWPAGLRSHALPAIRSATEAYGYGTNRAWAPPTAAEIAMMDIVLPDWLLLLDGRDERMAVTGVAMGMSLRTVGRVVGCSHEHARTLERRAVAKLSRRLNQRLAA